MSACGWNPAQATTDCDWDRNCPVHGENPTVPATVAAVGALPMPVDSTPKRLGHATPTETVPALLATIKELRDLQAPLIDALNTVHQSMTSCVGDEWAEEWLGEVWTQLPLQVRAAAGDKDAADELAASKGAAS